MKNEKCQMPNVRWFLLLPFLHAYCTDLIFGNLRNWILRRDRQLIYTASSRPMIGNENRVGPNCGYDHCRQSYFSAPRFDGNDLSARHTNPGRKLRMHFNHRLRILVHEWPNPSSLGAGKKMANNPA